METGTSFTTLDFDAGERYVGLRRELGVTSLGLNLILLEPGQRGRVHRHERQEEVYVVLEGVLTLELEGGEARELRRWDAVRVGPDVRRRLVNGGPERVALLAMGGAGEHRGRDGLAWESWEPRARAARPRRSRCRPTSPAADLRVIMDGT
jgi:mannose-6-phosphate isomerase-like protein (cupin superfamily)